MTSLEDDYFRIRGFQGAKAVTFIIGYTTVASNTEIVERLRLTKAKQYEV